jgi:hypothetical protein
LTIEARQREVREAGFLSFPVLFLDALEDGKYLPVKQNNAILVQYLSLCRVILAHFSKIV